MAIKVNGTIVSNDDKWIYDWFEIEAVSPKSLEDAINAETDDELVFEVNSGGGDVIAGNEMYSIINKQKKPTRCDIVGLAASAATIICCAANRVRAVPGALYMIHNASAEAEGDYNAMDKMSEVLKVVNKSISNIYRLKTGLEIKELLKLMNNTTWMDVDEAMQHGFVDEMINNDIVATPRVKSLSNSVAKILSDEVKEKIRNTVKNPDSEEKANSEFFIQNEQLNLLRMKGAIKHV